MSEFDEKAATWDDDPVRVLRANAIAERMREILDLGNSKSALEYGSGTGLLSFSLKDELKKIVLMDASEGMTEVAKRKCADRNIKHLVPVKVDLLKDDYIPENKFDLVFTLLTLHHVEDIDVFLSRLKKMMDPGGTFVVIDLEKEDGSFHDGEFHGHLGFERAELESALIHGGFKPEHYEVCYEIEKGEGKEQKTYPVFMMVSRT